MVNECAYLSLHIQVLNIKDAAIWGILGMTNAVYGVQLHEQ